MSHDCIVLRFDQPTETLPSLYVIKSGDTLTKIAAQFGFASWRDIYHHPENAAFRRKRPNPDKIFPGDELVIPGHPVQPSDLPPPRAGGGGFFRAPLTMGLNFGLSRRRNPNSDQFDLNYKHPGNVKLRLSLFWVTNCVKIDTSPQVVLDKAEKLYAKHGIGLDIFPSRTRTKEHTIETKIDLLLPEHYNAIRLEAHKRFDDQKTPNKKQRLPVFFCEFKDISNGLTITGAWLPYVFVSGVLTPDKATLAHEIVHAAGIPGHNKSHPNNIMADGTNSRSEFFKFQVQTVAKGYFAK
jgi:hypothetical protein